jgi:hypothetical protein
MNIPINSHLVNNNLINARCAPYVSRLTIPAASMLVRLISQSRDAHACSIYPIAVCL